MTETAITWSFLAAGLAMAGAVAIVERRPRKTLMPRLVPTTPILFVGMLVAVLALVHLLNIWGFHTGRQ